MLIISILYTVPLALLSVNASTTGEVCVGSSPLTGCPLSSELFNATAFPSPQLHVPVFINSSQPFNIFDITLRTDHTILKPAGADLTGTVLAGGSINVECLGGRLISGPTCSSTDTQDTLHLAVVSNTLTTQTPTSGLLFTAIYNVTAKTNVTGIGFQTGCGATSVPQGVCVNVVGAASVPIPEIILGAKFSNQLYFDFQPELENSLTVDQGGRDNSLFLNVTSINDFKGTVSISTLISPTGPTAVVSPTSLIVNASISFAQNTSIVAVHVPPTTSPGLYNITFVATSGTLPQNTIYIPLTVPSPDFAMSAKPPASVFNVTLSQISTITIASTGNFSGLVTLSFTKSPGLQASLSATSFNININTPGTATLKVNATFPGNYDVNVTGTSGTLTHMITVKFTPVDFAMTVPAAGLVVPVNKAGTQDITVGFATDTIFNVTIHVTNVHVDKITPLGTVPLLGPGISAKCVGPITSDPTLILLFKGTTGEQLSSSLVCTVMAQVIGNYTVTVLAQSTVLAHSSTFAVQVIGPDFAILASPAVQTLPQGKSATITLTFTRLLGLNDTINLTLTSVNGSNINIFFGPGSGSTAYGFSATAVTLSPSSTTVTVTLTVTANQTMPLGPYTLSVRAATASNIVHIATAVLVVASTTSPIALKVNSVTPSASSAAVGSTISVAINVQNIGKVNETSTVVLLIGDLTVAQQNVTLTPGENQTVTLQWHTGQFSPGSYVIGGEILGVQGEPAPYLGNNLLRYSTTFSLTSSSNSVVDSPYFWPVTIAGVIVVLAVVLAIFLQSRRKTQTST